MFEHINIRSSVPVYQQIENEVRFAVASGRLTEGNQLPSVREMSETLNINPNTVAKSYRDLEVMGIVFTRRGMGVFISKTAKSICGESVRRQILGRLHEVVGEARAAGMTVKQIKESMEKLYASNSQPYKVDDTLVGQLLKDK